MRYSRVSLTLKIFYILTLSVFINADADNETSSENPSSPSPVKTDTPRKRTNTLKKPSFIPYCVTRDICKPVCDCAVYEECEVLEMDGEVRNKILLSLNQARSIQTNGEPQASGMPKLSYNMELEEISTCWAARCENEYSECFRTPLFLETTQTVGLLPLDVKITAISLDYWDRMIHVWLGQVRKTNAEIVSSLPAGKEGEDVHGYSQILADSSRLVGCAWSRSKRENEETKEIPSVIFVCTFAPRGPRQGEPIYKTGKACTQCESKYACDYKDPYPFLCKPISMTRGDKDEEFSLPDPFGADTREYQPPSTLVPVPRNVEPTKRLCYSGSNSVYFNNFEVLMFLTFLKFIF